MIQQTGQTKDVGFQFGLRKTFPCSTVVMWDFMFSPVGRTIWLGEMIDELGFRIPYQTKTGIEGEVRVFKPYSHVRMSWKKRDWENSSILQVRVMGDEKKSTVSFHQEKLLHAEQRAEMKEYWSQIMDSISNELSKVVA